MNFGNIILSVILLAILILIIIYVIIFLFKTDKKKTIGERLTETFHHSKRYILLIKMTFYPNYKEKDDNIIADGEYEIDKNNKKVLGGDFEVLKIPSPSPIIPVIPKLEPPEVFNVGRNIFTYDEADTVCKALGSRLASKQQIEEAYKKGGNWCNNGWSENMEALYPIQKEYYEHEMKIGNTQCGKPGINGGYMPFPDIKLSANCYGIKPKPDPNRIEYTNEPLNLKSSDLYNEYKEMAKGNKLNILPFNNNYWSKSSEKPSTYINKHYDNVKFKYNIMNQINTKDKIELPPINIESNKIIVVPPKINSVVVVPPKINSNVLPIIPEIISINKPKVINAAVISDDNTEGNFYNNLTYSDSQIFNEEPILPNNFNKLYLNNSENYSSLVPEQHQQFQMNNILSENKWLNENNINKYGFEKKILKSESDFNNIVY